jgi:hypothetical protein
MILQVLIAMFICHDKLTKATAYGEQSIDITTPETA